jgi:Gas vesicle synthesis protein GvpL/GvpF
MIWVYAICERPEMPPPRRRGLAQAPLDGVRAGELLAVISRHVHPPGDPALDALWVHERVVERIMADRAVLPMRFGTKLPDEATLRQVLAAREQELLATLARVRGRVEVGVRAMQALGAEAADDPPPQPPAPIATSGREYLEAKLRNGRQVEREAAALHEPLARLAVEVRRQSARAPEELLRASYLIENGVLARFRATVERLQRAHPGIAILCTGPWPPYSFVGATPALTPEPIAGGAA